MKLKRKSRIWKSETNSQGYMQAIWQIQTSLCLLQTLFTETSSLCMLHFLQHHLLTFLNRPWSPHVTSSMEAKLCTKQGRRLRDALQPQGKCSALDAQHWMHLRQPRYLPGPGQQLQWVLCLPCSSCLPGNHTWVERTLRRTESWAEVQNTHLWSCCHINLPP